MRQISLLAPGACQTMRRVLDVALVDRHCGGASNCVVAGRGPRPAPRPASRQAPRPRPQARALPPCIAPQANTSVGGPCRGEFSG